MARPLQTSELIFPELATNFSETLSSLKRSTLSITNRLLSINEDSKFVCKTAEEYNLPLIANERCGGWYIPPERKSESAYFKSTDGHNGQWSFSLRRLNTQVLEIVGRHHGCIIVDSTRRGKSMPDALSKTVPIWCVVLNRLLFPELPEAHILHTPPKCVSLSEHYQIEQRLDDFVKQVEGLVLDVPALRKKLLKPMRPIWVTRDSNTADETPNFPGFHPIVLCTASRHIAGSEMSGDGYIQGAGDDSEGWAHGLTAPLFWKHQEQLMNTNEDKLIDLISELLKRGKLSVGTSKAVLISPTDWLFAGTLDAMNEIDYGNSDGLITCGEASRMTSVPGAKIRHIHLECREKKLGSRDIRKQLNNILALFNDPKSFEKLYVCCPTSKDLSIGVILAILCLYIDDEGNLTKQSRQPSLNKTMIKQRLSWIMTSFPAASPSRATLQSVNDFLLTSPPEPPTVTLSQLSLQPEESFVSALFTSLAGTWDLTRTIVNFHRDGFAGDVSGTAEFRSRSPASATATTEYLYSESGTFVSTSGAEMQVNRRWIWRLSHSTGGPERGKPGMQRQSISIHFVKMDGETEDYLYNELDFQEHEGNSQKKMIARAEHPCADDFYKSVYTMYILGSKRFEVEKFEVEHQVKGPAKDYISHTWYTRQAAIT